MAVVNEIRQVVRRLMRSPIFTIVTLITVAIGIGANTAIFSVINGVLLKPLPYPDADALKASGRPRLARRAISTFPLGLLYVPRREPHVSGVRHLERRQRKHHWTRRSGAGALHST